MARNGSGTMSLLATFATAGQAPSATSHNAIMEDIASEITNSINKDGTKAFAAAQSMGGFKLTSLATATARTDAINLGQVQDGKANWVAAGGTADAITATYSPAITALVDGQECTFRAAAANATTTPTFAPNGLTARNITKNGGDPLDIGDIAAAGHEVRLRYRTSGTRWELQNPKVPTGTASTAVANTFTAVQDISISNAVLNDVTEVLTLGHRTVGTAAIGLGAGIGFQLENDAGSQISAASVDAVWIDPVDTSEDAKLSFKTRVAGAAKAERGYIAQGMVMGSATGGDKGAGTINATAVYDDNVQLLPLVSGTMQATTSGTSIDFTSIPSTVKRITIMFRGVSTNGTEELLVQIGDAGGIENTGYVSTATNESSAAADNTTGFVITTSTGATDVVSGTVVLTLMDAATFVWIASGTLKSTTSRTYVSAGDKALSATLDRVRITTTSADTFDAGSINIMYE